MLVLGVHLAAAASDLSCWDGLQTFLFSSDSVLMFSSKSSASYSSESSYLAGMFVILLLVDVWECMVVVKGKVVELARSTVRYCVLIVGSTLVLLE